MKKRTILASILAVPLLFGGVAFAGNYHKVTICYEGVTKEVQKRYLGHWLQKGATEGECPVDVCPNIEGIQENVPEGYELKDGKCVEIDKEPPKEPEPKVNSLAPKSKPIPINESDYPGK